MLQSFGELGSRGLPTALLGAQSRQGLVHRIKSVHPEPVPCGFKPCLCLSAFVILPNSFCFPGPASVSNGRCWPPFSQGLEDSLRTWCCAHQANLGIVETCSCLEFSPDFLNRGLWVWFPHLEASKRVPAHGFWNCFAPKINLSSNTYLFDRNRHMQIAPHLLAYLLPECLHQQGVVLAESGSPTRAAEA